jgi:hypothetical protein
MRRQVIGVLLLLGAVPVLWGQDKPKADPPGSPKEQYKALLGEVQKAQQQDVKAYQQAKTEAERQKAFVSFFKRPAMFTGRFLELAQKNPKDPVAFDALSYIVAAGDAGPDADKATSILLADHAAKLGALCQQLGRSQAKAPEPFLRAVLAKSTDRNTQGQACYGLAMHLKTRSETAHQQKQPNADKMAQEAEKLLEQVTKKYADVKAGSGTLGDAAKKELFEIQHLSIGKTAPEIEGEDIDGKKFKLSDYRGKVVVLDFWGNW